MMPPLTPTFTPTFEDLVRSMNDQMLTILRSWHQGSIEAYDAWMKAVASLMPELNLYTELPTVAQDALGDPEAILDNYYHFAIEVLGMQREFVAEVFKTSMIAPRTPHIPHRD